MSEETKICSKCGGEPKPLDAFPLDNRSKEPRRRADCKACALKRSKAWRAANKDKVNERARQRQQTDKGRAQGRERRARWRRRYPAEAKRQLAELRAKHTGKSKSE